VFFGTPSCRYLPGQISHPTLLYVLADIDLLAPALVPAAAVVGLASCGRLSVAGAREVPAPSCSKCEVQPTPRSLLTRP
jgi:hypothetical protein